MPTLGIQTVEDTTNVTVSGAYVDSSTFAVVSPGFDSSSAPGSKPANDDASFAPLQNSTVIPEPVMTAVVQTDYRPPAVAAFPQVNAVRDQASERLTSPSFPATAAAAAGATMPGTSARKSVSVSEAKMIDDRSAVVTNPPALLSGAASTTTLLSETTNTVPPSVDSSCQLKPEPARRGGEAAPKRKRTSGDTESDDDEIAVR